MMHQLEEATAFIKHKGIKAPEFGVVLATGLAEFLKHIEVIAEVKYFQIPHFPVATMEKHSGKLIYGKIGDTRLITMQGRFHYYEGYSTRELTFPIRIMHLLGVKNLLLSNVAGALNERLKKEDLVMLDDHINLLPENPLRGTNVDALGPRFPDMIQPYHPGLQNNLMSQCENQGIHLKKGTYACVQGPNLETPAEHNYLRNCGADMVGMSTVPEVIVANHMGLRCAAVSLITNENHPGNVTPIDLNETQAIARKCDLALSGIFANTVAHFRES